MTGSLTPSTIRALLESHGMSPSRALGQNFLADPNTAQRIVREAGVSAGDRVLEVGPGVGSLTVALLDAGAQVLALELDRHLLPVLEEVVRGRDAPGPGGTVRIEQGDALGVDLDQLLDDEPWTMVSNLPYNVAVPIVVRVLEAAPSVTSLLVMVQSEVANRLTARPGTKAYGAVTVKIDYHAHSERVGSVPPTVFIPRPNVDSALVRLVRRDSPPIDVPDPDRMFELVRTGFAQRRKTLGRALRPLLGADAPALLRAAGLDPSLRAERLELSEWAALARAVPTIGEGP